MGQERKAQVKNKLKKIKPRVEKKGQTITIGIYAKGEKKNKHRPWRRSKHTAWGQEHGELGD